MLLRCRCLAFFIVMLLSQTIDVVASDDAQTARESHTPSFRNDVMAVLARSGCGRVSDSAKLDCGRNAR